MPRASIHWHASLFTARDVGRIAEQTKAQDRRLVIVNGVDLNAVARALHRAFHDAMALDIMMDLLWQQDPAWFKGLARDVDRLLKTLGLTVQQCTAMQLPLPRDEALPAIYQLREAAQAMPSQFWPPVELPVILGALPAAAPHPDENQVAEDIIPPIENYATELASGGKGLADVLLQLLPRTLGLVRLLADLCVETTPTRPVGTEGDILVRELFNALIKIHVDIYGRGPRVRNKAGERQGASIRWAQLILQTARDRMPAACGEGGPAPGDQVQCIPAFVELASQEDKTVGSWLEAAWRRRNKRLR